MENLNFVLGCLHAEELLAAPRVMTLFMLGSLHFLFAVNQAE